MKLTAFTSTFLLAASALAETVLDVSSLPAEEAQSGRGCCVTGVVTMVSVWRDRALTLADPGDPNGPALYVKCNALEDIHVGDVCEVKGPLFAAFSGCGLKNVSFVKLGSAELPPAPLLGLPASMQVSLLADLVNIVREKTANAIKHGKAKYTQRSESRGLSEREVEILVLVAKGCKNREIGEMLGVSENSIKMHLKHIFAKLEVADRAEAVSTGIARGIIHV